MDTSSPKPEATPTAGNVPEFSVAEISGAVRRTLEGAFGRVRVRGEITECKRYPSGHIYLSLKDENAKLESVIWKTSVPRLSVQPENGVEVIATGRITTYADRSKYQMVIDRLEYAGEGALLARIEKLRAKLAAEGLFETSRKRPLPALPQVVGVVTSEAGAVIQDIRTTIARRFPRRIILWPVPVQGAGAAEKIAAAIAGFGALPAHGPIPRPDVLIVARGGGSLEDLMAFNEEVVVRAAAACPIPLISAVGHETDTTLIDFAADRRAPTPTAAAERAVPARAELLAALDQTGARLRGADRDASAGATDELARIIPQLRAAWPEVRLTVRADSGFCRDELLTWCEAHAVDYVIGLQRNSRLVAAVDDALAEVTAACAQSGAPERAFCDLTYRTQRGWSRERRVVAKAEALPGLDGPQANPRFVVTSLPAEVLDAQPLYEILYCARGDMENRIKEQQLMLFADRTSAATLRANQLRLTFSSVAYTLLAALRRLGLAGTRLATAQCQTIRLTLLKLGARLRVTVRKVWVAFATGCPHAPLFATVHANLRRR